MKKWQNLILSVVTLLLIASCSSVSYSPDLLSQKLTESDGSQLVHIAPETPFNREEAFYPLRKREDGKILPSYQWDECKKRFIWCTKWEIKRVYFEDQEWFLANGFGLMKRPRP
jgi:hypothetical protein